MEHWRPPVSKADGWASCLWSRESGGLLKGVPAYKEKGPFLWPLLYLDIEAAS